MREVCFCEKVHFQFLYPPCLRLKWRYTNSPLAYVLKHFQQRNFWVRGSNDSRGKVDFIWIQDSMVFPIEVKSGHNAHLRSLHSFLERSSQTVGIRVWSQPFSEDSIKTPSGKECKLLNIPFYLVGELSSILAEL